MSKCGNAETGRHWESVRPGIEQSSEAEGTVSFDPFGVESLLKRVLIANRGEIAIRVARAASALGVETVSVYAPADSLSLHTRVTTESRVLGASNHSGNPVDAYLDIDSLIDAARTTRCDSVHPGYGFLSENAAFAKRCLDEGITFIGPRPETLALFGDKTKARIWPARSASRLCLAASMRLPALKTP